MSIPGRPVDFSWFPSAPHVHWADLLSAMAYAKLPLRTSAEGIDCIDCVVTPVRHGGSIAWFPLQMSHDIRSTLATLLEKLPRLRYPLSQEQEDEFIRRFLTLEPDPVPNWIPVLLHSHNIERDQHRRHDLFLDLRQELSTDEDFRLFDEQHNPTLADGAAFLDSVFAERILRKRGLFEKVAKLAAARPQLARLDCPPPPCTSDVRYPGFPRMLQMEGKVSEEWRMRTFLDLGPLLKPGETRSPTATIQIQTSVSSPGAGETASSGEPASDDEQRSTTLRTRGSIKAIHRPAVIDPSAPSASEPRPAISTHQSGPRSVPNLLSANEVAKRIGKSRSTVYNRIDKDHPSYEEDFPKPRKVGPSETLQWVSEEIDTYILSRPASP